MLYSMIVFVWNRLQYWLVLNHHIDTSFWLTSKWFLLEENRVQKSGSKIGFKKKRLVIFSKNIGVILQKKKKEVEKFAKMFVLKVYIEPPFLPDKIVPPLYQSNYKIYHICGYTSATTISTLYAVIPHPPN